MEKQRDKAAKRLQRKLDKNNPQSPDAEGAIEGLGRRDRLDVAIEGADGQDADAWRLRPRTEDPDPMTGRIKSLSAGNGSGCITADNGLSAHFLSKSVLEYDVTCLAVGQMVTFDLETGSLPVAVNVSVQRQHRTPLPPGKQQDRIPLRYVGFNQAGTARLYKFERLKPGEPTETLVVTADMALFRKHRVGLQEGPGLCLRALEPARRRPACATRLPTSTCSRYLASRPAPRAKPRHIPPPRHPAVVLNWPRSAYRKQLTR